MVLVLLLVAVAVALVAGLSWSVPVWLVAAVAAYMLRDPPRVTTSAPLALVSPVDGRVLSVGASTDPFLHREALLIRMRMNRWGAFVIRSPIEGKVFEQWFVSGVAQSLKGGGKAADGTGKRAGIKAAGRRAAWIKTDEGDDVTLVIQRMCWFCRPRLQIATGERVGHGQRCGFLLGGGALVDLFVPATARLDCSAGDRVLAGSAIISTLVHK